MTTDLATVPQLRNAPDLSERDRDATRAVASGLRDAKADNIRRACASAHVVAFRVFGSVLIEAATFVE